MGVVLSLSVGRNILKPPSALVKQTLGKDISRTNQQSIVAIVFQLDHTTVGDGLPLRPELKHRCSVTLITIQCQ